VSPVREIERSNRKPTIQGGSMRTPRVWLPALIGLALLASAAPAIQVHVDPVNVSLNPGDTAYFTARAVNQQGQPIPAQFTWSVFPPNLGQITPFGRLTAGNAVMNGHVRATTEIGGQVYYGQTAVHLVPTSPNLEVEVDPATATVALGQQVEFEAELVNPQGQPAPHSPWLWFVDPPNAGFVTPQGVFHAGPALASNTVQVVAECVHMGHLYLAAAEVTVTPAPEPWVAVLPPLAFCPVNGTVDFNAVLHSTTGQPLPAESWTWTVDPPTLGAVSDTGLFTAGADTGTGWVRTVAAYQGQQYEGQALVHVGPPGPPPPPPPPPGGGIMGLVQGQTSTGLIPLPGARVTALPQQPGTPPRSAMTNPQGVYILGNLQPGSYIVKVEKPGFLPCFYPASPTPQGATPVAVDTVMVDSIDVVLLPGARITGVVVNQATGQPLGQAMVVATKLGSPFVRQAFSQPDGHYEIGGLIAGDYVVRAHRMGFQPEFYDNVPTFQQATHIPVTPPAVVDSIDFSLAPMAPPPQGGSIAGDVTDDSTGAPVAPGWVMIFPQQGPGQPRMVPINPQGHYVANNLPPGNYLMQCWAPGYLGEFYENASTWAQADPVAVVSGQQTEIDFGLAAQGLGDYRISGRVVDASGDPLSEVSVYLEDSQGGALYHAVTQADGWYEAACDPGQYRVRAEAVSYEGQVWPEAVTATLEGTGDTGFLLEPAALSADPVTPAAAENYRLLDARPNPFNPATVARFELPAAGHVSLRVYDTAGRLVQELVNGWREPGVHEVTFDASGLTSRVYLLKMEAGTYSAVRKMVLLK